MNEPNSLESSYQYCEALAKSHYENFPVASLFLPKPIRRPIAVIYTFARLADDMADEGNLSKEERLNQLQAFWDQLENLERLSPPDDPVFIALQDVLKNYPSLPKELFFDLLRAFKQDITKQSYNTFEEVLDYCKYSANPIGRLLLYLTDNATADNLAYSDNICTALQLINFYQDLHSDLNQRKRCYLPLNELEQQQVALEKLMVKHEAPAIQKLISLQIERAQLLLQSGAVLGTKLSGLFGLEIRFIIQGGLAIVKALKSRKSVYERPVLRVWDWPRLFFKAFFA